MFMCSQHIAHVFNDTWHPPERVVVLRRLAGDAADFQYGTFSCVLARGLRECTMFSMDLVDSNLSDLFEWAPLLPRVGCRGHPEMPAGSCLRGPQIGYLPLPGAPCT